MNSAQADFYCEHFHHTKVQKNSKTTKGNHIFFSRKPPCRHLLLERGLLLLFFSDACRGKQKHRLFPITHRDFPPQMSREMRTFAVG